jgi:hypothetical protein
MVSRRPHRPAERPALQHHRLLRRRRQHLLLHRGRHHQPHRPSRQRLHSQVGLTGTSGAFGGPLRSTPPASRFHCFGRRPGRRNPSSDPYETGFTTGQRNIFRQAFQKARRCVSDQSHQLPRALQPQVHLRRLQPHQHHQLRRSRQRGFAERRTTTLSDGRHARSAHRLRHRRPVNNFYSCPRPGHRHPHHRQPTPDSDVAALRLLNPASNREQGRLNRAAIVLRAKVCARRRLIHFESFTSSDSARAVAKRCFKIGVRSETMTGHLPRWKSERLALAFQTATAQAESDGMQSEAPEPPPFLHDSTAKDAANSPVPQSNAGQQRKIVASLQQPEVLSNRTRVFLCRFK